MPRTIEDLGRAAGGSLLFALPLLMTQEVWEHALTMRAIRLALLVAVTFMFLIALTRLSGFSDVGGGTVGDAVVDAGVAVAVGTVVAAVLLAAFGVLDPDLRAVATSRRVALGAVPASIGAAFARSQLTSDQLDGAAGGETESYGQELLLMVTGAVIVSLNIAPTVEVVRIAGQGGAVGALAVLATSVAAMHVLVHRVGFAGSHDIVGSTLRTLLRFTVVGYVLVALVCAFVLWCFGRADAAGPPIFAHQVVVLALPGAVGAAVARLVL